MTPMPDQSEASAAVSARRSSRDWTSISLMIGPALLISLFFFVVPMLVVLANSLSAPEAGDRTVLTFANYLQVLTDGFYWEVLGRTLRISAFITAAALLLGYPAALYLYFSKSRWRRVFLFIIVSPLFVSVIVRTYGWIILFSPNGPINALLPEGYKLRLLHTQYAIVIGLMHVYIPFMVLSLNASMANIDKRLLTAAASLGASSYRIFRDVFFPLSLPGVLSGCIIVFSISMTAFTTPILLGGVKNKTTPYLIYQENLLLSRWGLGSALAFVLLVITLAIVFALTRLTKRDHDQMVLQ
jgi:putative spermidine/putrescine transport system permease protein